MWGPFKSKTKLSQFYIYANFASGRLETRCQSQTSQCLKNLLQAKEKNFKVNTCNFLIIYSYHFLRNTAKLTFNASGFFKIGFNNFCKWNNPLNHSDYALVYHNLKLIWLFNDMFDFGLPQMAQDSRRKYLGIYRIYQIDLPHH